MKTLEFRNDALWLLEQTRLPGEEILLECRDYRQVADAIRRLAVRGAPAIGLAAAYGTVLAAQSLAGSSPPAFKAGMNEAISVLASTRPTAINLFWALDRMKIVLGENREATPVDTADALLAEAHRMRDQDEASNRKMGAFGAELIADGSQVLTHCNAGALATGAFGTALGAVIAAHAQGKQVHVWVDETRPLLQGARLTAWELSQNRVPYTVITDSMAGHFMAQGKVDLAVVGADRIAANGDTANKIGTYAVAVLAHAHHLPLYVVAPTSTIDMGTTCGDAISIEERNADEVNSFRGERITPSGARVANPAFDVTPARLITAIVTERGIVRQPLHEGLARIMHDVSTRASRLTPGDRSA
ncbi:MAG: S-methyl-5-thioribose-1-phosphate isomerase [Chloroflexota bacterium]